MHAVFHNTPSPNPLKRAKCWLFLLVFGFPGWLAGQSPENLEKVVLQLRWEYEFQFAGFIAAKELGYYRDAGLDVEIRELGFDGSVYEELRSGRAQYAVGTTDAIVERANGTPVVALAAIFQHTPFIILSRADAGIRSPEDLVGQTVSVYGTNTTIFDAMLQYEGVDPDRIDIIPYDQDYSRIASGEVSATSAMLTLQPYVFEQMGIEYSVMDPRTYGIDFYGNILITLEDEILEHPDRVSAFREASLQGWRYALDNSAEIIDLYLNEYSPDIERGLFEFEASQNRDLINPELIEIGHMNPGRWEHIAGTYRDLGIIRNEVGVDEFLYDPYPVQDLTAMWRMIGILSGLTLLVTIIAVTLRVLNVRLKKAEAEKQTKIEELKGALSEIKTLRDMLPICAACKKIRDDEGFWENVETYITKHTSTVFSHGICPECVEELYPEQTLSKT